jgi:hypothetical protein
VQQAAQAVRVRVIYRTVNSVRITGTCGHKEGGIESGLCESAIQKVRWAQASVVAYCAVPTNAAAAAAVAVAASVLLLPNKAARPQGAH